MAAQRVALVTGTSTGIGLSTAILLSQAGFKVIATMRDLAKADGLRTRASSDALKIEILRLDVQDQQSIKTCVDTVLKTHGRIDVLVNNAGAGFLGTLEQTSDAALTRTMDVNFFGVWRTTHAVLPHMRAAGSGHIISVSSIGGLIGQPFNDAYCAAKFAVEGMMESLAPVTKTFGVHVSLIEPGPVNTEFVATVRKEPPSDKDAYAPLLKKYFASVGQSFQNLGQTADDVAKVIVAAATSATPHLRYPTAEFVKNLAARKYVDTSGDSVIAITSTRLT